MKCKRCGGDVDKQQKCCPACGRRVRSRLWVWILLTVLAVALLAAALWLFGRGKIGGESDSPDFITDAQMVTTTVSNTVRVTVPEGYTVERIAALLEQSEVCTADEFRTAVREGNFSDFAFVADIPLTKADGSENGRVYRLEGYLFPDTYEFYRHSGGEAAVRRFLQNFVRKAESLQAALDASGHTLDEAVTLASIIQWEAAHKTDMARVARVLQNRLDSPAYPRLQCDTTVKYVRELKAANVPVDENVYNTYTCRKLPVGAINNPGIEALTAAMSPSDEAICADCFFFVTDDKNNAVYYSKTYEEHLAACREHKLGSYADS